MSSSAVLSDTDDPFVRLRRQMPVTERWAYFDHAAITALPAPVRDVFVAWSSDLAENGTAAWGKWRKRIDETRRSAATLVNASPDEIALVRNTTEGIGLVAEGIDWQPGDNVVVPEGEFPTNLYPWLNLESRGVEVRIVPTVEERLDVAAVESACDARTRVVAVSWVGYATGWRNDLDALVDVAHRRGARLCVDAIQGLGVLPLDVTRTPVDFFAADGHKWLLGPEGAGMLYIRRDRINELRPLGVGWNSVRHAGNFSNPAFDLKPSAARYEGGSYNKPGFVALGVALDLLLAIGVEAIEARLLEYTDCLVDRLRAAGAEVASDRERTGGFDRRSGIVSFTFAEGDPTRIRARCQELGVVLNCRRERLRASPHVYNDDDDLERLIAALRESRHLS